MAIGLAAKLRFMAHKFAGRIDSRLNLDEIDRYWSYPRSGDAYLEAYQHARRLSGSTDDLAKQMRFHTLMQAVRHVVERKVRGDVVECGCWRGHSSYMIASALHAANWQEQFLIFDSFAGGLSDKVAEDLALRGNLGVTETARQRQLFASDRAAVEALLAPFGLAKVHEGWIPEVFAKVENLAERRVALLHIDVDLYEPTRASLEQFGRRVAEDGVILIDDYGGTAFPGATRAVDEYVVGHPPRLAIEGHAGGMLLFY